MVFTRWAYISKDLVRHQRAIVLFILYAVTINVIIAEITRAWGLRMTFHISSFPAIILNICEILIGPPPHPLTVIISILLVGIVCLRAIVTLALE